MQQSSCSEMTRHAPAKHGSWHSPGAFGWSIRRRPPSMGPNSALGPWLLNLGFIAGKFSRRYPIVTPYGRSSLQCWTKTTQYAYSSRHTSKVASLEALCETLLSYDKDAEMLDAEECGFYSTITVTATLQQVAHELDYLLCCVMH